MANVTLLEEAQSAATIVLVETRNLAVKAFQTLTNVMITLITLFDLLLDIMGYFSPEVTGHKIECGNQLLQIKLESNACRIPILFIVDLYNEGA